jgi:solute carrier family 8 (sodium/calcium exchanger)
VEEPVWNATIANLSLMALGSSMPEIFLAVLETLQGLGEPAGELGPSTIVGSAAFNLLVISGLSIYAVDTGPKMIEDVGVFAITSSFSCLAYIWLFICLAGRSYGYVTIDEAWITFLLFWVLLILAWTADRCRAAKKSQIQSEEQAKTDEVKIKRSKLRQHA